MLNRLVKKYRRDRSTEHGTSDVGNFHTESGSHLPKSHSHRIEITDKDEIKMSNGSRFIAEEGRSKISAAPVFKPGMVLLPAEGRIDKCWWAMFLLPNFGVHLFLAVIGTFYASPEDCHPLISVFVLAVGYVNCILLLAATTCVCKPKVVRVIMVIQSFWNGIIYAYGFIVVYGHLTARVLEMGGAEGEFMSSDIFKAIANYKCVPLVYWAAVGYVCISTIFYFLLTMSLTCIFACAPFLMTLHSVYGLAWNSHQ